MKTAGKIAALAGAIALVAFPAAGVAKKGDHGKRGGHAEHAKGGKGKGCAKAHSVGFQVGGTLVSVSPMTLTVTSANKHARDAGGLVKGAAYTVAADDTFELKLSSDYGEATPAAGDRVKVKGRVAVTKKHCVAEGASRYGTPDVTRVSIRPAAVESEPEAPEAPEPPETETP